MSFMDQKVRLERDDKTIVSLAGNRSSSSNLGVTRNDNKELQTKGSWIGDCWIPPASATSPERQLYSAQEFRRFFANESILFVGDSTGRRLFATLFHILNSTDDWNELLKSEISDPSVIDVNKAGQPQENCTTNSQLRICRRIPHYPSMRADFKEGICNSAVMDTFQHLDTSPYTLIVVAYGAWHQARRCKTTPEDANYFLPQWTRVPNATIQQMKQFQRQNLTIVWRTVALPKSPSRQIRRNTWFLNRFVMDQIHQYEQQYWNETGHLSSLTALDWGLVMKPRAFPNADRIEGDMQFHFGFEARLVFLQMLMRHLVNRRKLQQP